MVIKKDSVLYHTSDEEFIPKVISEKPMLFCTFHPSEYTGDNKYVHYVKIKKDISLLFMIEYIGSIKIYSSLPNIINHPNKNLAKKDGDIDDLKAIDNGFPTNTPDYVRILFTVARLIQNKTLNEDPAVLEKKRASCKGLKVIDKAVVPGFSSVFGLKKKGGKTRTNRKRKQQRKTKRRKSR
jgi:hypothetical protein